MNTNETSPLTIELDEDGYLVDYTLWNEEIAAELAREEGIDPLTEEHMKVIYFMRAEFEAKGTAPSIRKLNKSNVVSTKDLYRLFPGGPAKKAARIAGLKKPQGCI